MKRVAFLGAMTAAVAVLVVVLAYWSVDKDGRPKFQAKTAEACDKEDMPGGCLPRIGYLDTEDTMWTGDLLDGKVVMVNFWATWCKPCKKEVPALTHAYEKYADEGFVLLGVMVDSDDVTDEKLAGFSKEYNLDYPVVRIDQDIWHSFGEPNALPTTFIYNRLGRLDVQHRGPLDESRIDRVLGRLLAEKTPES